MHKHTCNADKWSLILLLLRLLLLSFTLLLLLLLLPLLLLLCKPASWSPKAFSISRKACHCMWSSCSEDLHGSEAV